MLTIRIGKSYLNNLFYHHKGAHLRNDVSRLSIAKLQLIRLCRPFFCALMVEVSERDETFGASYQTADSVKITKANNIL